MNAILGIKSHMQQSFTRSGSRVPVTVVKTPPNLVTFIKTRAKDNYTALQLGLGTKKIKHSTKAILGHLKGAIKDKKVAPRFLREVKVDEKGLRNVGDTVEVGEIFREGDLVSVTGITRGKGFAGVVKRHGFAGGPKTHGQSDRHRAPGSIGLGTTPGRVYKGKRMAGHMGVEKFTVRNLTVLKVDDKEQELWLSGPIPGARRALLTISKIGENKRFDGLWEADKEYKAQEGVSKQ